MAHRNRVFPMGSRMRLGLASDEWLVGCVRRGDTAAFEALYDRHVRELLGFCVYMLGSRQDAEDAVQATFASAYRALRADSRPVALRPWLFTIARNDCLSILRRRRPVVELGGEVAPGPDPAATAELREEVRRVFEGLRELPERQRAALVLAEVHGLSQAEIGEVLGVRTDQVKAFVYQARSTLISERRARDSDCQEIREQLAGARGAALLRGRLRRHVRSCADCRSYADGVARQRIQLGALLPIAPSLALKYRALEEALGIGSSDPATVVGGATVGATVAGTAAEFAGGGMNALVCKLAVGMVCVGATAGVGVSVLNSPTTTSAEGQAAALASGSSPALLSASTGESAQSLNAAGTPLLRDLHGSSEQHSANGGGQAPTSGSLPEVQNGLASEPETSGSDGGSTPVLGAPQPAASGGGGDPLGDGSGARGEVQHRAAAQQRGREHEARRQLIAERQKAKEERVHEGGSKAPPSEEELALKHEESRRRREERKPEGHSKPPPTEEQLKLKKEKTERHRAEKRKQREEEAALQETPSP